MVGERRVWRPKKTKQNKTKNKKQKTKTKKTKKTQLKALGNGPDERWGGLDLSRNSRG